MFTKKSVSRLMSVITATFIALAAACAPPKPAPKQDDEAALRANKERMMQKMENMDTLTNRR